MTNQPQTVTQSTGNTPVVRTPIEQRRDQLVAALHITRADAQARLNGLLTNYSAKLGDKPDEALAAVLALDPERLLDLLAFGPAEAVKLLPGPAA
jgi:hypothetical protein